jgi:hypothetical protein
MRIVRPSLVIAVSILAGSTGWAQSTSVRPADRNQAPQREARQRQVVPQQSGQSPADSAYAKIRGGLAQGFAPIDTDALRFRSGER